jgi:spore germination cell wall hydrolase CwlJ-like protein
VRQGSERGACQFSWWCDGRPDDVKENESHALAKEVARRALNRQLPDRTAGAMYFHHRKVSPAWSAKYMKTARIGDHIFYRPRGGNAK